MSRVYSTVAHDYGKPIVVQFQYANPLAGLLSDVVTMTTTVVAVVRHRPPNNNNPPLVDRKTATVVSSDDGVVTLRYNWATPETATVGVYDLTFEAAATGGPVTLPTGGAVPVVINTDLG